MTTASPPAAWDEEFDVVVIGSGVAGMTAAIVAHQEGLRPVVLEKTAFVGGTAARSMGAMWLIETEAQQRAGAKDSRELARRYFAATVADAVDPGLQQTYIEQGRVALDYMLCHSALEVDAIDYPDYYPELDGGTFCRFHLPREFDGRLLGPHLARLRPPLSVFMLFGGLMLDETDQGHFLNAWRSPASAWHTVKRLARYGVDRLRYPRGTRLLMGNALVARLYRTILDRAIPVRLGTQVQQLIVEDGAVAGVRAVQDGRVLRIRARRGVVIASGGYPGDAQMRRRYSPQGVDEPSVGLESNTGDGIRMALQVGARVNDNGGPDAYHVAVSVLQDRQGQRLLWPHFAWDRPSPGLIAVDARGNRFVNESSSYHDFVLGMYKAGIDSAWLVCDHDFLSRYRLGHIPPGWSRLGAFEQAGYLHSAATLDALARRIGVDVANLARHVARHNEFARTGIDTDFGKGSNAYNRFKGDPTHRPNPCLGPIARGPFHAVQVVPGNFGTSKGLATNIDGCVLDDRGATIAGLYACGNDMNSPVGGRYIGAGITLGPALTFGYLIGRSLASGGDHSRANVRAEVAAETQPKHMKALSP